jgi:hypothetical protein
MKNALLCLLTLSAGAQAAVGVRLILGLTDKTPTKWDGSVSANGARIVGIEPWRFENGDAIEGNSWRMSTRPIRLFGGANQQATPPVVANGVVVWVEGDENGRLDVVTAAGNFSVRLADIPFGKPAQALGGRAMADRIPGASRIAASPQEQDFPAAAVDKSGNVWLAYLEFTHHAEHNKLRWSYRERPANFDGLNAPTGGDRILARKYSNGVWGDPIEVSPAGGDVYRPAVAVDGSGRVWVFWSSNDKGDFDLWARPIEAAKPGRAVRLSSAKGSDIDPAAATDSSGKVWVAWQAWRNGRASIVAAEQKGNGFSAAAAVSNSKGNEWNPAVAADASGRVTVVWDSYRAGNYDVMARTAASGKWGAEIVVAATAKYEAYPSAAYDKSGRLWVAYEEGGERWGKDFGAYDTNGLALYQGRAIRLKGFESDGRISEAAADLAAAMPGTPSQNVASTVRQSDAGAFTTPDPGNAKSRVLSRPAANVPAPKNTMPRLTVDASGRLWLAFRSAHPIWWSPLGTVWTEHVSSFDGKAWTGPVFLAHSDNLLDNRPALVSVRAGELMTIGSADGRREFHRLGRVGPGRPAAIASLTEDPYNNDLWTNVITLPPASGALAVKEAPKDPPAAPDAMDAVENAAVARMRAYRTSGNLRLLRGEFHRHSEISADGGNDGSILDQWRYMLDAGAMDWVGCCDHDNGGGREYSWWISQKLTEIFYTPGKFVPMFSYERSVPYPEGHRNVIFAQRGIRSLPRLPITAADQPGRAPDTQMLYDYLKKFNGIVAMHTSGTNMGTDWRDNDPLAEPVVEIYQGDRQNYEMPGAPRTNAESDSIGGWRPKGFVSLALDMGYKLAFQASSDHISTHMSYCNILARDSTRESLLEAFQKRHVYGSTDNILAEFRSGQYMMGDAFSSAAAPELKLKLTGTGPFAKVQVIKDGKYVYTQEPKKAEVEFTWKDNAPAPGKTSYYYVRGEQANGEIVWVSPMWITYTGN